MPKSGPVLASFLLASAASATSRRPPIGTGLAGLFAYSTERPFLDAFKTSTPWFSGTKETDNDGRSLVLDQHGWVRSLAPGQVARTVLLQDIGNSTGGRIVGRYAVVHDGKGKLNYTWSARLVEAAPGRDLIDVDTTPDGAVELEIVATDPTDYVRNIRVTSVESAAASGEVFNPVFLDRLKGYKAIRFLGWMADSYTDSRERRWSERASPMDARWSLKGAPVEIMAALANRLHADAWFSMPYEADDDYFRRFAQALAKTLDPKLKVYVEYSNEVWNPTFPAHFYAEKKGLALRLSRDPSEARNRYYAKRAVEMFSIFEKALGKKRLVRVLSTQSSVPAISEDLLSYRDTRGHVDALATAPYFGYSLSGDAEASAKTAKMTLDGLMRELETAALADTKKEIIEQAAVARKHGLPLVAYESGQHLVDFRPAAEHPPGLDELYDAANRDPRMGALYTRLYQDWVEAGGGLINHLENCEGYSKSGRWGALEYISQPRAEAPKYDAIRRFIEGK